MTGASYSIMVIMQYESAWRAYRRIIGHRRSDGDAGRILNMGSGLGIAPMPYMAIYAASKHALEGYSESLDHELRTRGVRVVVIARVGTLPAASPIRAWPGGLGD